MTYNFERLAFLGFNNIIMTLWMILKSVTDSVTMACYF